MLTIYSLSILIICVSCIHFKESDNCTVPRISEYMIPYTLTAQQLEWYIQNNRSTFSVSNIDNSSVKTKLTSIKPTVAYNGSQRTVQKIADLELQVINDSFAINISLQAKISKLLPIPKTNLYKVQIQSKSIPVNFTKILNYENMQFSVQNTTVGLAFDLFSIASINPNPTDDHKLRIMGTIRNSLYKAIVQQFSTLNKELSSNAQNEQFSQVYPQPMYNYDYYHWPVNINTESDFIKTFGKQTVGLINGMKADVSETSQHRCPKKVQDYKEPYHTFLSMEFIQNFADYTLQNYKEWQSVQINSSNIRTQSFQFRLVDLQFLMDPSLFEQYGQYYMNPVAFSCAMKEIAGMEINETQPLIHTHVNWSCSGSIQGLQQNSNIGILDFQLQIDHQLLIQASSTSLSVYVHSLQLKNVKFNPVGTFKVTDPELATIFIQEMFNDLRVYLPGTFFKVRKGSKAVSYQRSDVLGEGLWIG